MNQDELDRTVIPDLEAGIYEHYSGKCYEVLGVALHSETLQPMVVYKPLYKTKATLWVRPYQMFLEIVEHNGAKLPRFRKVSSVA